MSGDPTERARERVDAVYRAESRGIEGDRLRLVRKREKPTNARWRSPADRRNGGFWNGGSPSCPAEPPLRRPLRAGTA